MRRVYFCIFVLLYSLSGSAAQKFNNSKSVLPDFLCKQDILKLTAKQSRSKQSWTRHIDENHKTQVYRRPMKAIGEWYELRIIEANQPTLLQVSNNETTYFKFDPKCKISKLYGPGLEFQSYEPSMLPQSRSISSDYSDFKDEDLKSEIKEGEGFIYVWSPNMIYSVANLLQYKDFARKNKMKFIPVMGYDSSFENGQLALSSRKVNEPIRKLASVELFMREASLHYPTFYYFKSGKLHPNYIRGILTEKDLADHLKSLKAEINKNIY